MNSGAPVVMVGGPLGHHVFADLHGVKPELLSDAKAIEDLLTCAALAAGATPIFGKFHRFGEGYGITGVLLLQESHISIHTWPEHGFAAVDAFMCGACNPRHAVDIIIDALRPQRTEVKEMERGPSLAPLQTAA
jgi:S-adenosylmethionine decarboxylase